MATLDDVVGKLDDIISETVNARDALDEVPGLLADIKDICRDINNYQALAYAEKANATPAPSASPASSTPAAKAAAAEKTKESLLTKNLNTAFKQLFTTLGSLSKEFQTLGKMTAAVGKTLVQMPKHAIQGLTSLFKGDAKANGGEAAFGQGLLKLGALLGTVVAGFLGLVAITALVAVGLKAMVTAIVENRREFMMLNAQYAASFIKLDIGRMFRNMQTGAATSETGAALIDALDKLETALQPLRNLFINLINVLGTQIATGLTALVEKMDLMEITDVIFTFVGSVVGTISEWIDKLLAGMETLANLVQDLSVIVKALIDTTNKGGNIFTLLNPFSADKDRQKAADLFVFDQAGKGMQGWLGKVFGGGGGGGPILGGGPPVQLGRVGDVGIKWIEKIHELVKTLIKQGEDKKVPVQGPWDKWLLGRQWAKEVNWGNRFGPPAKADAKDIFGRPDALGGHWDRVRGKWAWHPDNIHKAGER